MCARVSPGIAGLGRGQSRCRVVTVLASTEMEINVSLAYVILESIGVRGRGVGGIGPLVSILGVVGGGRGQPPTYCPIVFLQKHAFSQHVLMAGETGGGDREGPFPPSPINSISWVGPGGNQYVTKWALFTSLGLFFSNCKSCIGGFGPFETFGDPFPRGPPRPSPPPPTSRIISPALLTCWRVLAFRTAIILTSSGAALL